MVDLVFPVLGDSIPIDHSYPLLAALSGIVPEFHAEDGPRFAPITGSGGTPGRPQLGERSRLRVRVCPDNIGRVLPLSGKRLQLGPAGIRLGVPNVVVLVPAATLGARLVTFKHRDEPDNFLEFARDQLRAIGVQGEPNIPVVVGGERAGQPRRQVIRIKG